MIPQQCRYLLALAEYKNFSKAAAAVFVSQPYLSKLVASIENELGTILFDRTTKPMSVTAAGESYLGYLREILHAEQKMKSKMGEIADHKAGVLRVGIPPTHGSYILPDVLRHFKALYPGIKVKVEENNNKTLMDYLANGFLDMCCLSLPDYPKNVAIEVVSREYLLLVMPPDHPLGQKWAKGNVHKPVPFPADMVPRLADEPFIILSEQQGIGKHARHILADWGINPEIFMETRNIETAYRLAASGEGLTIIPAICTRFSHFDDEPYYFSIGNPPYVRCVSIVYSAGRQLSKAEQDFVEIVRSAM